MPARQDHTGAKITEQSQPADRGESAHAYNYDAFDFGSEAAELQHWRTEGPRIGDRAPDFELADLGGSCVSTFILAQV